MLEVGKDDHFDVVVVTLDGAMNGYFGHAFPVGPEELLADVAGSLQDHLSQIVWGGWPICPKHGGHRLDAVVEAGVATWRCPRGDFTARIGEL